jgi:hypothetical protein
MALSLYTHEGHTISSRQNTSYKVVEKVEEPTSSSHQDTMKIPILLHLLYK